MNKRGFTLIEILAVIIILALLSVLATSNIFGITDKVKNKISEVREKQFVKGATTLANEIDMCDITGSEITNLFNDETIKKLNGFTENPTCSDLKSKINNDGLMLTADFLKDNKYASGDIDDINYFYTVKNNKGKIEGKIETIGAKDTLGYNIFMKANDSTNTDATKYVESLGINPAITISITRGGDVTKVLSKTEDDLGNSYYYRGNVNDNYVSFAGMCFRIVRIEGDGSIKLILEDQDEECSNTMNSNWSLGSKSYGSINENSRYRASYLDGTMASEFEAFQTTKLTHYYNYLELGNWCVSDSDKAYEGNNITSTIILDTIVARSNNTNTFYFESGARLNANNNSYKYATLKCKNKSDNFIDDKILTKFKDNKKMYVGTLTADEIVFVGIKYQNATPSNPDPSGALNYLSTTSFLTLSLYSYHKGYTKDFAFMYTSDKLNTQAVNTNAVIRPAIRLKPNTKVTYDENNESTKGTLSNPYVVDTN